MKKSQLHILTRKAGTCILTLALDSLSMVLYTFRKLADPVTPHPFQPIFVDPFAIKHSIEPSNFVRRGRYRLSATVASKGWDPIIPMPPKHKLLSTAFTARFLHGINSFNEATRDFEIGEEDLPLFQHMFNEAGKKRYLTLFQGIRKNGFIFGGFGNTRIDPFRICIGEEGDLLFTTGKHRLALAKAIGLNRIPARVAARHTGWIRYRHAFHQRLSADCLREVDRKRSEHPDLQDLLHHAA